MECTDCRLMLGVPNAPKNCDRLLSTPIRHQRRRNSKQKRQHGFISGFQVGRILRKCVNNVMVMTLN